MSIAEAPDGLDPLALRLAEAAHRLIVDLDLPSADLPYAIAVRALAEEEIRTGLAAADQLRRLRADHQWITRDDDSTWHACTCGELGCRLPDALSPP